MSNRQETATEAAVGRLLADAQQRTATIEEMLSNLPTEGGPEFRPAGGPQAINRAQQREMLKQELMQIKENTLAAVDQELKKASSIEREHCEYAVGKWLYPGDISPEDKKDMTASQTMLARDRYEKKYPEVLIDADVNPLNASQERALEMIMDYRQRYAKDEVKQEANQEKEASPSPSYTYNMRYSYEPGDLDKELDKGDNEPELAKDDYEPEMD